MPLTRRTLAALGALALLPAAGAAQVSPQPVHGVPVAELAGLEDPSGACFDEDGVLHVSEARAHRVSRFARDGAKLGEWGSDGTLSWPRGLACSGGRLFVLDTGHGRLLVTEPDGRVLATAGRPGHGPGEFHDARALAVRGAEVAVADSGNDRVQRWLLLEGPDGALRLEPRSPLGPFAQPQGVAFLEDRALVVADTQADRLLRIPADDSSPEAWGARGEAPGLFSRPTGLAFAAGHLYSVDTENHRVQVFDSSGELAGAWGRHAWLPHEGEGRLHYPELVAIDPAAGRAAVCEPFEDRCQLFTRGAQPEDPARDRLTRRVDRSSHHGRRVHAAGRLIASTEMDGTSVGLMDLPRELPILIHRLGRPGAGHGLFRDAVAALVDGPDRIVVADSGARRIAVFAHDHDPAAESRFDPRLSRLVREIDLVKVGLEPPPRPVALARSGEERLLLLDAAGSRVVELDRRGTVVRSFGGFGEEPGRFRFPTELALDSARGELFVVDSGNARVQVFDRSGEFLRSFGETERLSEPFGLALGPEGGIFVSDRGSNRVLRYDRDGRALLQFGDADAELPAAERLGAGRLHRPAGLALTGGGLLLVVDHGHHRGQLFTTDGRWLRAFGARLFTRPTRGSVPPPPETLRAR